MRRVIALKCHEVELPYRGVANRKRNVSGHSGVATEGHPYNYPS